MNVARPIKPSEYETFRKELYCMTDGKETGINFTVPLDEDPGMDPKGIGSKLAKTQAFKDRVLLVLNRAILCESYWRTVHRRVESKYEAENQRAMLSEEVGRAKNQDSRKAEATKIADAAVVEALFGGEGKFEDQCSAVVKNLSDAIAFMNEVKNIYENLDDTAKNLAVQLKSVMVNARVYGDPSGDPSREEALSVSR